MWAGLAAVAAILVIAGVAIAVLKPTGRSSSQPPNPPGSYEVVYLVVNSAAAPARTTWEVLDVSDPFDVSDLTYAADPRSGAKPVSGTVSTFDHLYNLAGGRLTLVSDRQPGLGSGDQALVPQLPDLITRRMADRLGDRKVLAGQPCSTYRMSEPPAGPITALLGGDHDDLCLTSSGLELGEVWTYGGGVVLERTAMEVDLGKTDARIAGPPVPGGSAPAAPLLRIGPVTQASFLAPPPDPTGFAPAAGVKAVQAVAFDPTNPSQELDTSTIWAFRRGGDVITVEAGTGQVPWDDTSSPVRSLQLQGLGPAHSALESAGPEIQVALSGGRWVRVDGTVPVPYLAQYAGRLRLG